jgi:hypothetical protein
MNPRSPRGFSVAGYLSFPSGAVELVIEPVAFSQYQADRHQKQHELSTPGPLSLAVM